MHQKDFLTLNNNDDVKTAEKKFQKFDTTEGYFLDEKFLFNWKTKVDKYFK